jgi:hypothetical protein
MNRAGTQALAGAVATTFGILAFVVFGAASGLIVALLGGGAVVHAHHLRKQYMTEAAQDFRELKHELGMDVEGSRIIDTLYPNSSTVKADNIIDSIFGTRT